MKAQAPSIRPVDASDAAEASALVRESFLELVSQAWGGRAQQRFLADATPEALRRRIAAATCTAAAFCEGRMAGLLLMPRPTLLGMLFVHPGRTRQGIATNLWAYARKRLESEFPRVHTVELNATPYAVQFYRAAGFVPISAEFVRDGARVTRMACWLPARELGAELPPAG